MANLLPARRNRRFALAAALYLAFVYSTLPVAPLFARWVFSITGRAGYSHAINGFIIAAALTVLVLARRRLFSLGSWRTLALLSIALGYWLVVLWADFPSSRLHALQYGVLAFLVTESLRGALPLPRMYGLALSLVMVAGLADEGIQMLLPNRSALASEVLQNWASAGLAQAAMLVLKDSRLDAGKPLSPTG